MGTRHRLPAVAIALIALLAGTTLFASPTDPVFVSVPALSDGPVSGTAVIQGLRGGRIVAGRYAVRVPPAAFIGRAQITVRVPNPSRMQVELEISPASANRFLVPVILEADCSGGSAATLVDVGTVRFNESTGRWDLLPGVSLSLDGKKVLTPLWHFSKYGQVEGKAGW